MNNRQQDSTETGYKSILELAQSQQERDILIKIKDELNLRENDALWKIVGILQFYERTVESFNSNMRASVHEAIKSFAEKGNLVNISTDNQERDVPSSVSQIFLAAMLTLMGTFFFVAGATLAPTSPEWLLRNSRSTSGVHTIIHLVLSAPAGWILAIVLLIPASMYLKTYFTLFKSAASKKERLTYVSILISLILLILSAAAVLFKLMYNSA